MATVQDSDIVGSHEIDIVANKLDVKNWKALARQLQLKEPDIHNLEYELRFESPRELIFKLLDLWIKQNGSLATKQRLIQALIAIQRHDLAKEISGEMALVETLGPQDPLNTEFIRSRLQKSYKNLYLPRTSFLKSQPLRLRDLCVNLHMKLKTFEGEEKEDISLDNLFGHTDKGAIPSPILIEAAPGYGKTTLVNRILYDWAEEKPYLKNFKFVFFMNLNDVRGNLEDHFCRMYLRRNDRPESLGSKNLLLLDGLNEMTEKGKLFQFLNDNPETFRNFTIAVTCRSGLYHMPTSSGDDLLMASIQSSGSGGFEDKEIWERRVQIKGLSPEERTSFLEKYLKVTSEKLVETLSRTCFHNVNDLCKSPLHLLIFATIVSECNRMNKNLESICKRTALYQKIVNFILDRSNDNNESALISLLDTIIPKFRYRREKKIMSDFGKLCIPKLPDNDLFFTDSELTSKFLQLDFVEIIENIQHQEQTISYRLIHDSFRDFFVAFHVYSQRNKKRKMRQLFNKRIYPSNERLVYPFLAGLLGEDVCRLLQVLQEVQNEGKQTFSIFQSEMKDILREITIIEECVDALLPFVPKSIDFQDVCDIGEDLTPLFNVIFQKIELDYVYICNKSLESILTDSHLHDRIREMFSPTKPMRTKQWRINIDDGSENWENFDIWQVFDVLPVRCKDLTIEIRFAKHCFQDHRLDSFLRFLRKTIQKKFSLIVKEGEASSLLPLFQKLETESSPTQEKPIQMNSLKLEVNCCKQNITLPLNAIVELVKKRMIDNLDISFLDNFITNDFYKTFCKLICKSHLQSFFFNGQQYK